jgi:hypothetical protein
MPGMVVHACNPSTWEADTGGSQLEVSLNYTEKPCLKTTTTKTLIISLVILIVITCWNYADIFDILG